MRTKSLDDLDDIVENTSTAPSLDVTPREIYEDLDRYVIGQNGPKRTLAIAAYNHLKRVRQQGRLLKKNNILMVGPTGSGKTHLARCLARVMSVPFVVVNATEYTEAGYYGKDVEVMIAELLFAANGDVRAAERGIVFVDEIDKIARRGDSGRTGAGGRDIGGEGVQQALLKLLEGNAVFVPLNVTQHWNKHDFVRMDVTDVLFICAGTFSDMRRGSIKSDIGFTGTAAEEKARARVTFKDLEGYGLIAELLGRLPVIAELGPLSDEELGKVVTDPPDSIYREYQELFDFERIRIDLRPDGLQRIVRHAQERKTGARGLRSIFEELFHDLAFEAPERIGQNVVIDADFVEARLAKA